MTSLRKLLIIHAMTFFSSSAADCKARGICEAEHDEISLIQSKQVVRYSSERGSNEDRTPDIFGDALSDSCPEGEYKIMSPQDCLKAAEFTHSTYEGVISSREWWTGKPGCNSHEKWSKGDDVGSVGIKLERKFYFQCDPVGADQNPHTVKPVCQRMETTLPFTCRSSPEEAASKIAHLKGEVAQSHKDLKNADEALHVAEKIIKNEAIKHDKEDQAIHVAKKIIKHQGKELQDEKEETSTALEADEKAQMKNIRDSIAWDSSKMKYKTEVKKLKESVEDLSATGRSGVPAGDRWMISR